MAAWGGDAVEVESVRDLLDAPTGDALSVDAPHKLGFRLVNDRLTIRPSAVADRHCAGRGPSGLRRADPAEARSLHEILPFPAADPSPQSEEVKVKRLGDGGDKHIQGPQGLLNVSGDS